MIIFKHNDDIMMTWYCVILNVVQLIEIIIPVTVLQQKKGGKKKKSAVSVAAGDKSFISYKHHVISV